MRVIEEAGYVDIELTRTNLRALLAKLDGFPPNSACTISKGKVQVRAVEDDKHYSTRPRGKYDPETERALRDY